MCPYPTVVMMVITKSRELVLVRGEDRILIGGGGGGK